MYFIIGGDTKEYGPVSADDIRQWVAEGRLNAQSLAKSDGDTAWRTLASFPEFADLSGAPAPAAIAPPTAAQKTDDSSQEHSAALRQIKAPAIALKITSALNFILSLWSLIRLVFSPPSMEDEYAKYPQLQDPAIQKWIHLFNGPLGIGSDIFAMAMAAVIFFGAWQMQKLRGYEFAFVAAILAMLPCVSACCLLSLPFGIWALVILSKAEIKSQFK